MVSLKTPRGRVVLVSSCFCCLPAILAVPYLQIHPSNVCLHHQLSFLTLYFSVSFLLIKILVILDQRLTLIRPSLSYIYNCLISKKATFWCSEKDRNLEGALFNPEQVPNNLCKYHVSPSGRWRINFHSLYVDST